MTITPPVIAAVVLVSLPPLLVFLAAIGRYTTGWLRVAVLYPHLSTPPANAHHVGGQSAGLRGRPRLFFVVNVRVSDDTLWLSTSGPFAAFYPPIQIPLADVTLRADDGSRGGADLLLRKDPSLTLALRGDGAQLVIARVG